MEMKDFKQKSPDDDIEYGHSSMSEGEEEGIGDEEEGGRGRRGSDNNERRGRRKSQLQDENDESRKVQQQPDQPPQLRLGEGKLTGPLRFITCYASVFTFVIMTAIIVGLLLISPPFNVEPEKLPGRPGATMSSKLLMSSTDPTMALTSAFPPDTGTPEFSDDFNQADDS